MGIKSVDQPPTAFLRRLPLVGSVSLMGLIALSAILSAYQLHVANEYRHNSQKLVRQVQSCLASLLDVRRGVSNFLLLGQPSALETVQQALQDADRQLATFDSIALNDLREKERLDILKSDGEDFSVYSKKLIDLRKTLGVQGAIQSESQISSYTLGHNTMVKDFSQYIEQENNFVASSLQRTETNLRHTTYLCIGGSLLSIAFLVLSSAVNNREIALRSEAQEKLAELNILQNAMLNCANYVILTINPMGTLTSLNRTAERWFGYPSDQLIGTVSLVDLHKKEEIEARAEILSLELQREIKPGFEVFAAGLDLNPFEETEWTYSRRDGTHFWGLLSLSSLCDEQGKHFGYLGILKDITKRKQAETQLSHSLKETRDLSAALDEHAIVAITDPEGKITYANDKFVSISKYTRAELIGKDHRILNSQFHSKDFMIDLRLTVSSGKVWRGEIRNKAKDGSYYWVDSTIIPFFDENNRIRQFVAIRSDVTKRKRAEEEIIKLNNDLEEKVKHRTRELSESERKHRFLSEEIPQIMWTTTPEGQTDYFNQRWLSYTGQTIEQSLGAGWTSVLHPDDLGNYLSQRNSAYQRATKLEVEIRLKRGSDGEYRWHLGRSHPVFDGEGRIIQWVGISTDIHDLKAANEKIKKINEDLEKRVSERTHQLRSKNNELIAASEAKSDFLAKMSHELKTPLNGVVGFSEILMDGIAGDINADQKEYLQNILASGKHLLQLIDDILDL